jgi:hypothetical protein
MTPAAADAVSVGAISVLVFRRPGRQSDIRHSASPAQKLELDVHPPSSREVRHGCSGGVAPAKDLKRDAATGQQIGSNHDPTGNNTQGCVTMVFCGTWAQATDLARTNVHGLQLEEVA